MTVSRSEIQKTQEQKISSESADDLYSYTVDLRDGNKVLNTFAIPIKYITDDGKIKFVENKIEQTNSKSDFYKTHTYKSSDSPVETYFPNNIRYGVITGNAKVTLIPNIKNNSFGEKSVSKSFDGVNYERMLYKNTFGNGIDLEYVPSAIGLKENIIINEYNGNSKFNFILKLEGLKPVLEDGIILIDKITQEPVGVINEVDMRDSYKGEPDGGIHFTLNNRMFISPTVNKDEYILQISVDEEFLKSEKTVYPVIIDPSVGFSAGPHL